MIRQEDLCPEAFFKEEGQLQKHVCIKSEARNYLDAHFF